MRRIWVILLFGFVPALFVGAAVLATGVAARPPKFTARAMFLVDWNTMPSVPNDEQAQKFRANWRKSLIAEITGLPNSDDEISDVIDRAAALKIAPTNRAALAVSLKNWLSVRLVSQTNECDLFLIELRGGDTNAAQTSASVALHGIVAKLSAEARLASGMGALRSHANVDDVINTKADLGQEIQRLKRGNTPPYPKAVRERLTQLEAKMNNAEFDHMDAGLSLLSNLAGTIWNNSIQIVEEAHVVRADGRRGARVVQSAAVFGGFAGAVGLGLRLLILAILKPSTSVGCVPPYLTAQPPVRIAPPVAQPPPSKPPILPSAKPPIVDQS